MKLEEYRKAMDSVSAPQDAMQRALESVRNTKKCTDNISAEENKPHITKRWIPAAAAALVIAVAFGAVFAMRSGKSYRSAETGQHSFVIKAGAAEVNPDFYVEIGEMKQDSSSWSTTWNDTAWNAPELNYKQFSATVAYTIDNLKCSGENVDYYTYTVHGGFFIVDGETGEILQLYSDPSASQIPQIVGVSGKDYHISDELTDDEYNAYIAFGYSDDTGKYRKEMCGDRGIDENGERYLCPKYDEVYYKMFKENAADTYLLITAHYQDGTTLSKKLVFDLVQKAEYDEEDVLPRYVLTAKLAE